MKGGCVRVKQSIKKFDVVLVNFGVNVGSEQDGERPAIVVQNDIGNYHSPTTLVMPCTTAKGKHHIPTHTPIRKGRGTGLKENSIVLGECMRQVSEERIIKLLGRITDEKEQLAIKEVYFSNWGE